METLDPKSPNHILVGVGGTGGKVLKAIRKRIYQEFPNDEERDKLSIGFVYVDSTREMMTPGDPSFRVMVRMLRLRKVSLWILSRWT